MDGPKRELNWWEYYPLHQLWCNDYLPLVPRFRYRKGDEYNSDSFGLHWLIFNMWTMSHFSFGFDIDISFSRIGFGFILPYFRIFVGVSNMFVTPLYKIERLLNRDEWKRKKYGQ